MAFAGGGGPVNLVLLGIDVMGERHYHYLVIASLVVGGVSATLDLLFPTLVPQRFHDAQRIHDGAISALPLPAVVLLGIVVAALYLASIYGLYRFRSWAPRLSIITTVVLVLVNPLTGASTQSGIAMSLSYLASYMWGAVLVLPFTPPLKARLVRPDA